MFPHSIRWRLNLWLGFLLLCLVTGFGFTVYEWQHLSDTKQVDDELALRVEALSHALRVYPQLRSPTVRPDDEPPLPVERPRPGSTRRFGSGSSRGLPSEFSRLFNDSEPGGYYFAIWSANGGLLRSSANAPSGLPMPARFQNEPVNTTRTRGDFREGYRFNSAGDCVLAGRSAVEHNEAQRRFALLLLAAGGGVLALGLGVSWWLTTRAIRPVEEISAAARRISAGNLSERIRVVDARDELGRLAGVLNSTFARLDAAFAQQKQFSADASHELRTPLAVIISEAQTTLARERTAPEYRETIETCLDAAQQMRRLSHSLLELSRFDAGQEPITRLPFDLAAQARATVELIRPLAHERGLQLSCDLAPAPALGDADRIGQVITNLLTNAIHYNKSGGEIRVATRAENGGAVLTVTDTGQGIAPEDLPHIFERFYRADKSRTRAQGQSGLGLAICKAIMDTHSGTIEVKSQSGIGSTFTVRLAK